MTGPGVCPVLFLWVKGSERMDNAVKEMNLKELKEYLITLQDGQVVRVDLDELKEKKDGRNDRR